MENFIDAFYEEQSMKKIDYFTERVMNNMKIKIWVIGILIVFFSTLSIFGLIISINMAYGSALIHNPMNHLKHFYEYIFPSIMIIVGLLIIIKTRKLINIKKRDTKTYLLRRLHLRINATIDQTRYTVGFLIFVFAVFLIWILGGNLNTNSFVGGFKLFIQYIIGIIIFWLIFFKLRTKIHNDFLTIRRSIYSIKRRKIRWEDITESEIRENTVSPLSGNSYTLSYLILKVLINQETSFIKIKLGVDRTKFRLEALDYFFNYLVKCNSKKKLES